MLAPTLVLVITITVLTVLYFVDPNQPGNYPTCPWYYFTGTYDPGDGTLRALHALTHGDIGTALARNPLTLLALGILAVIYAQWSWRRWHNRPRTTVAPAWVLYLFFATIVAFWVLRNIPGWTWLSPA
ncbi:MAG: DUF2752 domain-containing protein [Beutenbergiaceae bacterium]